MEQTLINPARDIQYKVDQFKYFAYGEASVHYLTICKVLRSIAALDRDYTHAFRGAPDKSEIERLNQDMSERYGEVLGYYRGSLDNIKAHGNPKAKQHVYLLDEAYEVLKVYVEAIQEQHKAEGLASLRDRPYTVGVDENVDD